MEAVLYLLKIFTLLAVNWLVANYLSWLLTEWKRPLFPFKPFSCRPCLSFWLTCSTGAPLVAYFGDAAHILAATVLVSAFLNYYYIKSKIQIHD